MTAIAGDVPAAITRPVGAPLARSAFAGRRATAVVAVLLAAFAVASAWVAHVVVREQERRILGERASEAGLVVSSSFGSVPSTLGSLGGTALLTGSSPASFADAARPLVSPTAGFALVGSSPAGLQVIASAGTPLTAGAEVTGPRAAAVSAAMRSRALVATTVLAHTATTTVIGWVLGPPQAPPGEAVYEEMGLPRVVGRLAGDAFSELDGALYAVPRPDPAQLILTSAGRIPRGAVVQRIVTIGDSHWLLEVGARRPLVGTLATVIPWLLLGLGLLSAVLIAAVIDMVARRRDYALALVDERTSALRTSLTELEAAQARLVRQERLAAVGQLASAVGHELRNPLGVINNSLYLIRRSVPEPADDRLTHHVETAEREVAAATLIVSDLLDFSRDREPVIAPVEVIGLVNEVVEVAPPPPGVTVGWDPPAWSPVVAADRDQLRQVLINLVVNAYDAMPSGGDLRITVSPAGDRVALAVCDSGGGMDEETRRRLFEPFYTTKPRGTGLGLAVTDRIIAAHQGTITVDSSSAGTTFTITLPSR